MTLNTLLVVVDGIALYNVLEFRTSDYFYQFWSMHDLYQIVSAAQTKTKARDDAMAGAK